LNEVRGKFLKRLIQTTSYLPKFFSTVVVVSMINMVLSPSSGILNKVIELFGGEAFYFINEPGMFKSIYIISDLWQFMGWNAILYLAALTNIDPQLYEAAAIDGAGRWQQTKNVTIPGILPTVVITFILAVGYVLGIGFEKVLLLYTPTTYQTADVIQTYVYRMGIAGNNYSYATAIGLFQAVISLVLLFTVNTVAKRTTETSLW
jgi:putative aldouronate transport system permease protein